MSESHTRSFLNYLKFRNKQLSFTAEDIESFKASRVYSLVMYYSNIAYVYRIPI